jgi:hypothetical protein
MTESIQNDTFPNDTFATGTSRTPGVLGTTLCAERPALSSDELDFWHFAAEQYGIWLDDEEWCALRELDDHLLIARRYFWRLSDAEVHELLSAVPDAGE